ncbi:MULTISPECIES: hypothetical protein [unclassified Sphingopyxis]|nr:MULTISPECIES: hypothetical protein [unclassified Sphingopyxis]
MKIARRGAQIAEGKENSGKAANQPFFPRLRVNQISASSAPLRESFSFFP